MFLHGITKLTPYPLFFSSQNIILTFLIPCLSFSKSFAKFQIFALCTYITRISKSFFFARYRRWFFTSVYHPLEKICMLECAPRYEFRSKLLAEMKPVGFGYLVIIIIRAVSMKPILVLQESSWKSISNICRTGYRFYFVFLLLGKLFTHNVIAHVIS